MFTKGAINVNNQPWATPNSKNTINNALKLSAILAEHAMLVFGYLGADKSLEAAKKVWAWIERNRLEQFSARYCFQALKGTYKINIYTYESFLKYQDVRYTC